MPRTAKKTSAAKQASAPKKTAAVPTPVGRGPLTSMRVSESFRAFVLEQLAAVHGLLPRAMFGGVGLYADGVFFGLLSRDVLYLKVDETNRPAYEAAGSHPFKPYADRPMTMSYWQVPTHVLEDAEELGRWALAAVAVGVRGAEKAPKAAKKTARRTATPTPRVARRP